MVTSYKSNFTVSNLRVIYQSPFALEPRNSFHETMSDGPHTSRAQNLIASKYSLIDSSRSTEIARRNGPIETISYPYLIKTNCRLKLQAPNRRSNFPVSSIRPSNPTLRYWGSSSTIRRPSASTAHHTTHLNRSSIASTRVRRLKIFENGDKK